MDTNSRREEQLNKKKTVEQVTEQHEFLTNLLQPSDRGQLRNRTEQNFKTGEQYKQEHCMQHTNL